METAMSKHIYALAFLALFLAACGEQRVPNVSSQDESRSANGDEQNKPQDDSEPPPTAPNSALAVGRGAI
jgi:PBP1b-binding outer membrane lipoprotein LpoB